MKITDDTRPEVPSVLADLRQIPLSEFPSLGDVTLSDALGRVFPESPVGAVPVAAFNSSI
jgi:FXSXX-COOH protein